MRHTAIVRRLLQSDNPSIRWKVRVGVLDEDPSSRAIVRLRGQIRDGAVARALLAHRDAAGRIHAYHDVYDKWQGAHWVLAALAGIGYPEGDESLVPLRDQVFAHWLHERYYTEFVATSRQQAYRGSGVPMIEGRHRRCASQQGNALWAATTLGLLDRDAGRLVERLLHWQWPDGGWNCDKNPSADTSSFMETLLPMRGLAAYAAQQGDVHAKAAARNAAEVFLTRRLFKRRADGTPIQSAFTALHYPLYWHYDIVGGLTAMAELGLIDTPRCADALDLLEAKALPDGGWAAEARYYKRSAMPARGCDTVDWNGSGAPNEWLTAQALTVLRAAGRV